MARLTWGMIGGGEGSQIGPAHRLAARLDGLFDFAAGAVDIEPERGRRFARSLGVPADRAYGDWREMLEDEESRADRLDLVTIATPNATHYEIARAFLEAGFDLLIEKPMTMTVDEARDIVEFARNSRRICAVNYGYTGYPLVRHMRAMVARGDVGEVRLIKGEFAHGFHADAGDKDNARIRWRYDPVEAGMSAVTTDCGIHTLHMASFVTGQTPTSVSADFVSVVPGRALEDDSMLSLRFSGGAVGRLWTSAVAVGRMHGLTLQVFGTRGGLRWAQEWPNQLYWTPLNGPTQILERGAQGLSVDAERASRIAAGHAEGLPVAFANIYADLAEVLSARSEGREPDPASTLYPGATDGLVSVAAVTAAARSAANGSAWTTISPWE